MSVDEGDAVSAAELAAMRLPGLATSKRGILDHAMREGWTKRPREGRGGGYEFIVAELPSTIREAIKQRRVEEARLALVLPATSEEIAVASQSRGEVVPLRPTDEAPLAAQKLSDAQREVMDARLVLLREIDVAGLKAGRKAAVEQFIAAAANSTLRPELLRLVPIANARAGDGGRVLCRATIFNWLRLREQGGVALAPRSRAKEPEPAWAPYFLALYRRPQKPKINAVYERFKASLPLDIELPSIHQLYRYAEALSAIERNKGRLGPKELKALKPYVKRTTDLQNPLSVVTADGHTADFKVRGPDGNILRPEITTILDTKTRRVVGWTASRKENQFSVVEALCNCIERAGVPTAFYTDNGPGYCNELLDAPALGLFARLGIEHKTSIPYNSQARGKIERVHQSIWITAARDLTAYVGRDMDREAGKAIEKRIAGEIKERGASRHLMYWDQFIAWGEAAVGAYNARAHKGLPKIQDTNGRRRHMSPDEAWALEEAKGWQPRRLDAIEAQLLLRPQVERKCARGLVRLWNGEYFSRELEHHHDRMLRVGYDIHDASRVWVSDEEGHFICIAALDGHARPEFPPEEIAAVESRAKQIERQNRKSRIALRKEQIAAIQSEGRIEIELPPVTEITPAVEENYRAALEALPQPEERAPSVEEMDVMLVAKLRADWSGAEEWERRNFFEFAKSSNWRDANQVTEEEAEKGFGR